MQGIYCVIPGAASITLDDLKMQSIFVDKVFILNSRWRFPVSWRIHTWQRNQSLSLDVGAAIP
jgi:hypothetical protein